MKKRLLPLTLLCIVGMLATGCGGNPASSSEVPSSSSAAPVTSSEVPSSSSETPSSSSEAPVEYTVSITNAEELEGEWYLDDNDKSISLACAPGVVKDVLGKELFVTSSNTDVVNIVNNKMAHVVASGEADITATYHDATDTVHVTILGKRPIDTRPIKDAIDAAVAAATESEEMEIKGTVTQIQGNTAVIQEGDYAMYVYNKNYTGIEVGDLAYLKSTFCMYNGLPETKTVAKFNLLDDEGPEITPLTITKDTELTTYLASRLTNATGIKITEKGSDVDASTYRYDKTDLGVGFYVSKYIATSDMTEINTKLNKAFSDGMLIDVEDAPLYVTKEGFFFSVVSADQLTLRETEAVLPTSVTLSCDKDVIALGQKANITATFLPEDCNRKGLVWTSSDETVATVNDGIVTPVAAGNVTITATSSLVETVTDSVDIQVIAPAFDVTPVAGGHYFLGYEKGDKTFYTTAAMSGYYLGQTENLEEAGLIELVAGEGDNAGKFALKTPAGKFINGVITSNGTSRYYNVELGDTGLFWEWDAEHFTFLLKGLKCDADEDKTKTYEGYIGRYYKGGSIAFNAMSYLGKTDDEECHIFREKDEGQLSTVAVGDKVRLGFYHSNLVKFGYINGVLDGTYASLTTNINDSLEFEVIAGSAEGKFGLKSAKGFVTAAKPEGKSFYVVNFEGTTATDLTWNTEVKSFGFDFGADGIQYLGTGNTKTYFNIQFVKESALASNFVAHCYHHETVLPFQPEHDGTLADPYSIADAIGVAKELKGELSDERYVKGVASKVTPGKNGYSIDLGSGDEVFHVTSALLADGTGVPYAGDEIVAKGKIEDSSGYYKMGYVSAEEYSPTVVTITRGQSAISVEGEHATVTDVDGNALPEKMLNGSDLAFKVVAADEYVVLSVKVNGTAVTAVSDVYTVTVGGPVKIVVETIGSGEPIPQTAEMVFDGSVTPNPKTSDEVKFTFGVASFDVKKSSSQTGAGGDKIGYLGDSTTQEIRLYKLQELTFSCEETITKVVLTISNSIDNYKGSTFTNCTSAVEGSGTASLTNLYTATLTPTDGTLDLGISISKGAFRIHSITVYYVVAE